MHRKIHSKHPPTEIFEPYQIRGRYYKKLVKIFVLPRIANFQDFSSIFSTAIRKIVV